MREYKSNFLTNVIFRVDFPPILSLDSRNPPTRFQCEIKDSFPILEPKPGKLYEFEITKELAKVVTSKVARWQFFNKERTKVVDVGSDAIILEYFVYRHFKEFFNDVDLVFKKFFNIYDVVKICNRIGLRYINQVKIEKGDPFDWEDLINPELVLVNRGFISSIKGIKKCMNLLEFQTQVCNVKFQFGMFNSEYPNPIALKEFALDYDCSLKEELEIGETYGKVKDFNDVATYFFEMSIGDKLRKIMSKVKDE